MQDFAARVLAWFDQHGRRDLPWQVDPTPYRVWVSGIMLQQTQVDTVRGYYLDFMQHFPDATSLAAASQDQVLARWSGLGYYARGRNLHAAARRVVDDHGGVFPEDLDALMALPGIGRSTAGAILALSRDQPHPILDGNVKRVLARHGAIAGWPGRRAVETTLWQRARELLPGLRIAAYTQAMMDLGATVCARSRPACARCPVATDCKARAQGNPQAYPAPKPRKRLPVRTSLFLIARREDGAVMLERRPPAGLWGGLWSFPQCDTGDQADELLCRRGLRALERRTLPVVRHTFSHFHLDIQPLVVEVAGVVDTVNDDGARIWRQPRQQHGVGLPAAVVRLLHAVDGVKESA